MQDELQTCQRQGFGTSLELQPPFGLVIVDFVNRFADPKVYDKRRGRCDVSRLAPAVLSDCVGERVTGPHEANLFDMQQKYTAVTARDEAIAEVAAIEKR
jgi:hypothetical protein